jgi:hypothetical protein
MIRTDGGTILLQGQADVKEMAHWPGGALTHSR